MLQFPNASSPRVVHLQTLLPLLVHRHSFGCSDIEARCWHLLRNAAPNATLWWKACRAPSLRVRLHVCCEGTLFLALACSH